MSSCPFRWCSPRTRTSPSGHVTYLIPCGPRSRPPTSSSTPATGSTSPCSTGSRSGRGGWSAVYGNNDHGPLRERLPEVARAEIEGIRFAVVHETGDAKGREQRCAARFPDTDVLVFGHSHIPWDTTAPTGPAAAQPRLADRPAPAAARHLRHRRRRGRRAARRHLPRRPAAAVSARPPLDDRAVALLACPVCAAPLAAVADAAALRCRGRAPLRPGPAGPRHACCRRGTGRRRATRPRWSPTGWPSSTPATTPASPGRSPTPSARGAAPATLLDLGGGTGHHLAGVLDRLPDAVGVVLDSSRYAARRAARAHPRAVAVVADTWARLPVRGRRRRPGAGGLRAAQRARRSPACCAPTGGWSWSRRPPTTWPSWSGRWACSGWTPTRRPAWRRRSSRTCEPVGTTTHREQLQLDRAAVATLVGMGPHARHLDAGRSSRPSLARLPEPVRGHRLGRHRLPTGR